jgi:hypothetical protein
MPTPPRSLTNAHSAAFRLTTPSAVNIDVIRYDLTDAAVSLLRRSPVLKVYRPQTRNIGDVIPEIDMWRVANLMLNRYGSNAELESARRADELWDDGDTAGAAVWRRIIDAIGQLANMTPTGPVH